MTRPRIPNNCKWTLEDVNRALVAILEISDTLTLRESDPMPTRSALISRAAGISKEAREARLRIKELIPDVDAR